MTAWGATDRGGPLAGVKVLDFSRILSGPYATLTLADMGADVVKVEPLGKGDETRGFPPFKGPLSHYFIALNRGKKSIALDLKDPRGVAVAKALAAQADILIENFRPGVMERLGLGYDVLSQANPGLIYCGISGFGAESPLTDKPAFDIVAQALSGAMSLNRAPGQPPNKLGLPLGDMAGSIFAVFGVLAALHQRGETGKGQKVDVAMLDSLMAMLGYLAQIYFVSGKKPEPVGTKHPSIVPYGAFPTSDGHVIVACLTETFWKSFARCLGLPELAEDPRFARYDERLANRDALETIIDARMRQETTAYWLERLDAHDVPNAPILDVDEALEQPHVAARGLVQTVTHPEAGEMRVVRGPLRFDGKAPAVGRAPPLLGEDTLEVLGEILGMDPAACAELVAGGVASVPLRDTVAAEEG
ncbi:CaiB/BaiF CoA transferase family protein [Psychromarinibacter sp. S121]|uniref:CaiB/BaiF CoA transferase family protein n=1 Tax=Psychromarinibacter sp. S121 TaxID=3415127 RepID=UPI003C7A29F6